jgi:orotate phosphoribosyltransferase
LGFGLKIRAMTKDEALQIFRDSGALLEGHFVLRSGLHSRQFFQCALALQQMPVVEKLGAALAAKVHAQGAVTVIAPAIGGLVIGQEVARHLRKRRKANSSCGADSRLSAAKKFSSSRTW